MGISAARELVLLRSIVETNLVAMGYRNPAAQFIGEDGDGYTTLFVNYTDATYSTNDVAAFVRLIPAGDGYPNTMFTLSHSGSDPINGSVSAVLAAEGPTTAAPMSPLAELIFNLLHILRGNLGMPVELHLSTNGTLPTINGINGAGSTSISATSLNLPVTGRGYVGGV